MATEIVGREEELAQIDAFLDEDGPRALLLEGEAGIGKTTLWREAVERATVRGHRVLAAAPARAESGSRGQVLIVAGGGRRKAPPRVCPSHGGNGQLELAAGLRDDSRMRRARRRPRATLDDVVEYLHGIVTILMEIDAKLDDIARQNGEDEDGEEEA